MKKEEHSFISDLDVLLSDYNSMTKEQFTGKVIPLLKKVLGTIFFMDDSYTFEELVETIGHFRNSCARIETDIVSLQQEQASLLDKKNKTKHDQNFLSRVKELRSKIETMNRQLGNCQRIAKVLQTPRVEENLIRFCRQLSHLQFSPMPLDKQAYTALFFNFLWLVNQFMFDFHEMPKQGLSHFLRLKKNYDAYSIDQLIEHAQEALIDEDVSQATQAYNAILKQYGCLDKNQQARVYGDLFILWFELHFYEQRKHREKNEIA